MNNIVTRMSDSNFKGMLKYALTILQIFVCDIFILDAVTKLVAPYDIYKLDCKDLIPNSEAFKLRSALLAMKFKKKSCDLYSFSQSADFMKISNNQKPREVQQLLEVIREIKQKVATYLKRKFNKTISVSCSKYDHGGNWGMRKVVDGYIRHLVVY